MTSTKILAQRLLDQYHFNILKDMVRLLEVTPPSNKRNVPHKCDGLVAARGKKGHIQVLTPVLFTPEAVEKGLSRLSKREKEALATIQRANNRIETSRLRLQLLRQGVTEPPSGDDLRQDKKRYPFYAPGSYALFAPPDRRTSFDTVLGRLMATGLVCGEGIAESYYSQRSPKVRRCLRKIYYDNVLRLYIPEPVQRLLPEPPAPTIREFKVEMLTRVDESSARAFQRDIYFYWSTARANPLSLTKQGRLYKKDLRLVNDALLQPQDIQFKDEPDLSRMIFLRLLLTDMGLLEHDGQFVQAVEHPHFLGQKPTARIQRTFQQWRDGSFWNELLSNSQITVTDAGSRLSEIPRSAPVPGILGDGAGPVPQPIVRARKRVLDHIAKLHKTRSQKEAAPFAERSRHGEERWVPIAQLIDHIRSLDYDFLLPRDYRPSTSRYYYTYYGYTSRRSPYISYGNELGWNFSPPFDDEAEGWEAVEAGFIRAIVLEPLHWMGLVDIGYASAPSPRMPGTGAERGISDDKPVAYRLTSVGEWVLGVGREIEIPEGEGKVIVQPNYELFALDPISDLVLSKLDEFAERITAERAIKYVLTRESVYRAQQSGWTAARIIDTLSKMSDAPLPQNVVRTLEEWQTIHERITIHRRGSILQAADGQMLDQLIESPATGSHLTTRPDQTVAFIAPELGETAERSRAPSERGISDLHLWCRRYPAPMGHKHKWHGEELVRVLQDIGFPPARTRSPQDALRPSCTIDDDGQLHFNIALPSFYLFEHIAPFTGKDEQERYFLTQSAVQEAIAQGMTVTDILGRLQSLHLGPLPRWVEIKVRAWGHYYGDAAVQTITLVQIKDEKTLRELLAEPEVKDILHAFTPDEKKALALVSTQDLESLREIFAERGIDIRDQLD